MKQHKGWIDVHSEPGRGTAFHIHLPVLHRPAPVQAPSASLVSAKKPQQRETILVAEDEPALRSLVVQILEHHRYRVYAASCGQEALEIWAHHRGHIQLLVTDMSMPGMSGSELADRLHEQDANLRTIFTSGYSPGLAGKELTLLNGFNFLPKPFPPSKLLQLVRECLDVPAGAAVPA